MNLGVDLGSTYSSFSTYNKDTHNVEMCSPNQGAAVAVPSIACLDSKGAILTGHDARRRLLLVNSGARTFSAFKMLLTTNDEKLLQERGYGSDYTPRAIAGEFLSQQIGKVLNNYGGCGVQQVENLVICVPEVWSTRTAMRQGMLDGRTILRDICAGLGCVKSENIRIVSEPAAASAYFAHHYRQTNARGDNFSGSLLIIDYGGGTLDLTLTEVHPRDASVEIKVLFRTGAGENIQGRTGNAGIAYMERAVRLALTEAGEDVSELVPCNPDFRRAVDQLEGDLMAQIQPDQADRQVHGQDNAGALWNAVEKCRRDVSRLLDNHEAFTAVYYGDGEHPVTYAHLKRAYDEVVRPELDRCLEEAAEWMDRHGVDYKDSGSGAFQVVLVGGFGKYLLVQKQVEEFFCRDGSGDARFRSGLGPNREYAVSMGAALLASGVMTICHTAPYGIGICTDSGTLYYAISFRQEIEPGEENWICSGKDHRPVNFVNGQNSIAQLLIGTDENQEGSMTIPLLKAMSDRITEAYRRMTADFRSRYPDNRPGPLHNIGFSMDESEVVSILLRSVDMKGEPLLTLPPIELADYVHMFGFEGASIRNGERENGKAEALRREKAGENAGPDRQGAK